MKKSNEKFIQLSPLLIFRTQAQQLLGVSRATFYRRISEARIRPVRFGRGRPMYRYNDILRLTGEKP